MEDTKKYSDTVEAYNKYYENNLLVYNVVEDCLMFIEAVNTKDHWQKKPKEDQEEAIKEHKIKAYDQIAAILDLEYYDENF